MITAVPALFAALAVLAARFPDPATLRLRALRSRPRSSPPAVLALAGVAAALLLGPAAALAVAAGAFGSRVLLRRRTARRAARANAAALPEVCRAVAAELRAGAPPATALTRAAEDVAAALAAHLRRLASACQLGPPPPPDRWADLPGAERLAAVGALWTVAAHAGNGLADGMDRLAASLAADERQRGEVAAQLAGPTASAAVLAALPLCGLGLAATLGAKPVAFLLWTPVGLGCLVVGGALDAAGVWWVRRLSARASP